MNIAELPIRLARPSRSLTSARKFWVDGLGLEVLWESGPGTDGGHRLLMVGAPGAGWHLELVDDPESHRASRPGPEDLLVLYTGEPIDPSVVDRLVRHGGNRVPARNPYWDRWGVTIADPDGYLLVLSFRVWGSR